MAGLCTYVWGLRCRDDVAARWLVQVLFTSLSFLLRGRILGRHSPRLPATRHPPPTRQCLRCRRQLELAARVVWHDDAPWMQDGGADARLTLAGGLDISCCSPPPAVDANSGAGSSSSDGGSTQHAVAVLAVLSFPALVLVHLEMSHVSLTVPYASGYLAFR